jgi:hypothetical protein
MLTTSHGCIRFPRSFVGSLGTKRNDGIQSGIVCINLRQMRLQHFCG